MVNSVRDIPLPLSVDLMTTLCLEGNLFEGKCLPGDDQGSYGLLEIMRVEFLNLFEEQCKVGGVWHRKGCSRWKVCSKKGIWKFVLEMAFFFKVE